MFKTILTLCALVAFSNAFTKKEAMQYLFDFGHITALADDQFESGLREFQKLAAIPITGILDQETKRMMQVPRCSTPNPDSNGAEHGNRMKRYVANQSKWPQRTLNYHVTYPQNVSREMVDEGLKRALAMWAAQTGLRFKNSSKLAAHLNLRFDATKPGAYGYADPPGRGGGNVVFGSGFFWLFRFFYYVAVHLIGHALGLKHSKNGDSLMFPFYTGNEDNLTLHQDDIAGIKALYNYSLN